MKDRAKKKKCDEKRNMERNKTKRVRGNLQV